MVSISSFAPDFCGSLRPPGFWVMCLLYRDTLKVPFKILLSLLFDTSYIFIPRVSKESDQEIINFVLSSRKSCLS